MHNNLWAPWRYEYLKSFSEQEEAGEEAQWQKTCFLCHHWANPEQDKENLVLWRTEGCMLLFNRFPYTGGHLLIAPKEHVPSLEEMDDGTLLDMMHLCRDAQRLLSEVIHPHGFNIGININRCAGAGLPDHVHLHIVPRWDGDTNFMSTVGNARVISQSLEELYALLQETSEKLGLPKV